MRPYQHWSSPSQYRMRKMEMQYPKFFYFISTLLILLCNVCEAQECATPPQTITVTQSGGGSFKTIQSAIDAVPSGNSHWIHIKISPGVYREKVLISKDKPCIYLEGAGSNSTSIEWDDHGRTHFSATFNSKANNTVAKGIAFKNTYNGPVLLGEPRILQAVAARIHADKCAFFECAFLGVQDTLYDSYGRHYYHKCYIQGAVDFIFGDGQTIFEESTIYHSGGRFGPKKLGGFMTAHKRESPDHPSGYVFKNCTITGEGKTNLGRAYKAYARVIIANSILTDVVEPKGWDAWENVGHEENITFVEEGCSGAGADKSKRVPWMKHLNGTELDQFLNISFIDKEGWIAKLPTAISN